MTVSLPSGVEGCVGVRAIDAAGNLGPTAVVPTSRNVNCGPRLAGPPANPPTRRGCPRATGRLSGRGLGLVRLGMTRRQARRAYAHSSNRGRRYEDFFCLSPIGVRVGYASPKLLRALPRRDRGRVRGRVVWASTSSPFYSVRGVRPGARIAAAGRALHTGRRFHVGRNFWYFAPNGASMALLKVRRGVVEEIGIADRRFTRGRRAQRAFLRSFY